MKSSTPDSPKAPSPLKLLLMGPPGCWKTTLALQFPDVHVMDCDRNLDGPSKIIREGLKINGVVTVQPFNPHLRFTWDDIRLDDDGKMLDVSECYDRICDKLRLFQTDPTYKSVKTILIDSLSHVNEFIIRKVLSLKAKPSMEIHLWTDFASAAYTFLVARLDQSGKAVVCTVHEEKVTEADRDNIMKKRVVEINPLFSGRVGDSLGAFFTDVWKLEKRLAPGNRTELWCLSDRTPKCEHLKNSVGMPPELNVSKGFAVLEPYLKGRI